MGWGGQMREIKFRAWDGITMFYGDEVDAYLEPFNVNEAIEAMQEEGIVFMQFTGVRTKNIRAIYEGDIIQADCDYRKCIFRGVVYYDDTNARFRVKPYSKLPYPSDCRWELNYMCGGIIIGNIYENPELLNE